MISKARMVGETTAVRNARWEVTCQCGRCFVVQGIALRGYQTRGTDAACHRCRPRPNAVSRKTLPRRMQCGACGEPGHIRKSCPKRKPPRVCPSCYGLPHRVAGLRCGRCGLMRGDAPDGRHDA